MVTQFFFMCGPTPISWFNPLATRDPKITLAGTFTLLPFMMHLFIILVIPLPGWGTFFLSPRQNNLATTTIKLTINVKSSNYNGCLHRPQQCAGIGTHININMKINAVMSGIIIPYEYDMEVQSFRSSWKCLHDKSTTRHTRSAFHQAGRRGYSPTFDSSWRAATKKRMIMALATLRFSEYIKSDRLQKLLFVTKGPTTEYVVCEWRKTF